jgi:cytochrome P450
MSGTHVDTPADPSAGPTGQLDQAEADALLGATVLTEAGRQDPYPAYDRLRSEAPRFTSGFGSVVLSGYRDGLEALRHPKLGRPEPDMDVPGTIAGRDRRRTENSSTMLFLNPPDHTRIRSLVSRVFTPRRVEALRPTISGLLAPVLDRFAERGGGDVMAELAIPFPVAVISALLGVEQEGNEHLMPLVRDSTALIDAAADEERIAAGEAAVMRIAEFFIAEVARKRAEPDDALLSALIEVEAEGDRLSIEELIANTMLLYAAGFETTSNLIGNGLWALLSHPDQMERLRADRSLLPSAIWEMLRWDSPVQLNARTVLEGTELFGRTWQRGDTFIVLQGSGNRDPEAYPAADTFDVARFVGPDVPPPLSFGWGAHHCLGAHLARAEGEIVFAALLDRFESIELDTDALGAATPSYRPSFTLRGLESLPVRVS